MSKAAPVKVDIERFRLTPKQDDDKLGSKVVNKLQAHQADLIKIVHALKATNQQLRRHIHCTQGVMDPPVPMDAGAETKECTLGEHTCLADLTKMLYVEAELYAVSLKELGGLLPG